jgi:hypothetical protein
MPVDDRRDAESTRELQDYFICALTYSIPMVQYGDSKTNRIGWFEGCVLGLILELVGATGNTYRRVVMFSHCWDGEVVVNGTYICPEFPDIQDLSNLSREKIIIICNRAEHCI